MTKWYVALPFVLLCIFGAALILTGFSGEFWAFAVGLPMLGVGGWFMANKYVGTNG